MCCVAAGHSRPAPPWLGFLLGYRRFDMLLQRTHCIWFDRRPRSALAYAFGMPVRKRACGFGEFLPLDSVHALSISSLNMEIKQGLVHSFMLARPSPSLFHAVSSPRLRSRYLYIGLRGRVAPVGTYPQPRFRFARLFHCKDFASPHTTHHGTAYVHRRQTVRQRLSCCSF